MMDSDRSSDRSRAPESSDDMSDECARSSEDREGQRSRALPRDPNPDGLRERRERNFGEGLGGALREAEKRTEANGGRSDGSEGSEGSGEAAGRRAQRSHERCRSRLVQPVAGFDLDRLSPGSSISSDEEKGGTRGGIAVVRKGSQMGSRAEGSWVGCARDASRVSTEVSEHSAAMAARRHRRQRGDRGMNHGTAGRADLE